MRQISVIRHNVGTLLLAAVLAAGCGIRGGSTTLNDPVPSGTIVHTGMWVSMGGQTVTGTVSVYTSSSGTYTFRLEGISAPTEGGLQLIAVSQANGSFFLGTLRGASGNQNYTIEPGVNVWTQIVLHSPTYNVDYGRANL